MEAYSIREASAPCVPIRRRLSAAPLKRIDANIPRCTTESYPSTPVGGPIEAAVDGPVARDVDGYPSTPVGGPIEATIQTRWKRRMDSLSVDACRRPH